MRLVRTESAAPGEVPDSWAPLRDAVDPRRLEAAVRALAEPRHFLHQPRANARARELIREELSGLGYRTSLQGGCLNVVATRGGGPGLLVGAHYDSVPESPGPTTTPAPWRRCSSARASWRPPLPMWR